ncbi:MAG: transposase, partial [Candidatus Fischerbacteria bacterium RBG_13_37_8]
MDLTWAENEFNTVALGDQRLKERLIMLATRFSDSPESPINHACEDWAETKAAYRFFKNENIAYQEIIKSHSNATKMRCTEFPTILAIQDTTYFSYSSHPGTKGLCPLHRKKGKHKDLVTLGLVMHTTLAVSTDGLPLGIIDQKIYSRPPLSDKEKEIKRRLHNNSLPVEKKDSYRWIESLQNTHKHFKDHSAIIVTIADREADMYDLFQRAQEFEALLLIRANHDRTINKKSRYSEKSGEALWRLLIKKPIQAQIIVAIPEHENYPSRIAKCVVTFSAFTMHPCHNHVTMHTNGKQALSLYAIYVTEKNPPKNIEPIDWMLLTNIPILIAEDAVEKITWYCLRWRIEILHKILKSGLQVEECRLSTSERLIRYLAVMSIVAWRIFWLTLI